jgi:hypothetical protein
LFNFVYRVFGIILKNNENVAAQNLATSVNSSMLFNSIGWFRVQFASGNYSLFVRIVDNMGGVAIFSIQGTLRITMDQAVVSGLVTNMLSKNASSQIMTNFQTGSIQTTSQYAIALGNTLNDISAAEKASNNSNNATDSQEGTVISLDDRVAVRSMLNSLLNAIPISNSSSMKLVASSFSSITNAARENSLDSAVIFF